MPADRRADAADLEEGRQSSDVWRSPTNGRTYRNRRAGAGAHQRGQDVAGVARHTVEPTTSVLHGVCRREARPARNSASGCYKPSDDCWWSEGIAPLSPSALSLPQQDAVNLPEEAPWIHHCATPFRTHRATEEVTGDTAEPVGPSDESVRARSAVAPRRVKPLAAGR